MIETTSRCQAMKQSGGLEEEFCHIFPIFLEYLDMFNEIRVCKSGFGFLKMNPTQTNIRPGLGIPSTRESTTVST